jgi:hypothetical protein
MEIIPGPELRRKSNRELAAMKEAIRKGLGDCEQQRRKAYAALTEIRKVQAHRRNGGPGRAI